MWCCDVMCGMRGVVLSCDALCDGVLRCVLVLYCVVLFCSCALSFVHILSNPSSHSACLPASRFPVYSLSDLPTFLPAKMSDCL